MQGCDTNECNNATSRRRLVQGHKSTLSRRHFFIRESTTNILNILCGDKDRRRNAGKTRPLQTITIGKFFGVCTRRTITQ